jgi:SAM-dependent methyltransferase
LGCGANLRYELLARSIDRFIGAMPKLTVVELDPNSPLRPRLSLARSYTRTYWDPKCSVGSIEADGSRCEDITRLTFPDSSIDLIVSSEVLEHVPDIGAAGREIHRVLRPGGRHVFTVPTQNSPDSIQRGVIENGTVRHLVEPEYHGDPLGKNGILAFWTFGWNLPKLLDGAGTITAVADIHRSPRDNSVRVVWESIKPG